MPLASTPPSIHTIITALQLPTYTTTATNTKTPPRTSIVTRLFPALATMCNWEQTCYQGPGCGHTVRTRMEHSCTIYTRWKFGVCEYDPRRAITSRVISYDICPNCEERRQIESDTFDAYVDYPENE